MRLINNPKKASARPRLGMPIWDRTKEKTINAVNTELLETSWQTGGFHFQKVRHVSHIDVEPNSRPLLCAGSD